MSTPVDARYNPQAIDRRIPLAKWTYENIAQAQDQLKQLGLSYDWKRNLATCNPIIHPASWCNSS